MDLNDTHLENPPEDEPINCPECGAEAYECDIDSCPACAAESCDSCTDDRKCVSCGKSICGSCVIEKEGKEICEDCDEKELK